MQTFLTKYFTARSMFAQRLHRRCLRGFKTPQWLVNNVSASLHLSPLYVDSNLPGAVAQKCSVKKNVFASFEIFTEKHLFWSLFFIQKETWLKEQSSSDSEESYKSNLLLWLLLISVKPQIRWDNCGILEEMLTVLWHFTFIIYSTH